MRRLILAAAIAAVPVAAHAEIVVSFDRGGSLNRYIERVVSASGQRVVIDGECMSSCTIWLGHRGVCVQRSARLWFHAAQDGTRSMRDGNPWRTVSADGNAALLAFYPPSVREAVRPWLQSPEYRTLTGAQLIALGVMECGR